MSPDGNLQDFLWDRHLRGDPWVLVVRRCRLDRTLPSPLALLWVPGIMQAQMNVGCGKRA